MRTLVVWCEDWPVVAACAAAGVAPHLPAAVVAAHQVLACSAVARRAGVRPGQRRRQAQACCPELVVLAADPTRDAALFEPVVAAVESLVPGLELVSPGTVAAPARGAARYVGSEERLGEWLVDEVATRTGVTVGVGVADTLFAALLAARRGRVVPPGGDAAFLAPLPASELIRPELPGEEGREALVDLLHRLGLTTLGAFAALSEHDVASRFSVGVVRAHRQARGLSALPLAARRPPPDLTLTSSLDPPVDRIDAAAFAAKALADQFCARLTGLGLACVQLRIEVVTEHGEEYARTWRHEGTLSATAVAERTRWQLEGWLRGRAAAAPSAGISTLRLAAEGVVPLGGLQLGLWGGWGEREERVHRALARVQGMLGPDAVRTAVVAGGRDPAEQGRWVDWQTTPALPAPGPWPGRLPGPFPSTVPEEPSPVEVRDRSGEPVGVNARHHVTAPPHQLTVAGRTHRVLAWAGPWPLDERWWDPAAGRRRARFHVVVDTAEGDPSKEAVRTAGQELVSGTAVLLSVEDGRWWIEGFYN